MFITRFYATFSQDAKNEAKRVNSLLPRQGPNLKPWLQSAKKASLTRKTASGIEDFIQKQGYGKWFGQLFPYIQSRESAQPEQASEPSSSSSTTASTAANDSESGDGETQDRHSLYVPQKKRKVGEQNCLLAEAVKILTSCLSKTPQMP